MTTPPMDARSLWSLEALVDAMAGRLVGVPLGSISGISIDSRSIGPGDVFFAIKGDVHDGHRFVGSALDRGAVLAVVAEDKLGDLADDGRYVVVDDVLAALERLGQAARARTEARICAITGSVGKTSTKESLRHVLAPQGRVHWSVASFNNHWGVPLTLARMPADTDFGVFEIGMNHAGEITPLTRMVRPHVAVVTTVAPVHLEFFASIADIAKAKAEIFLGVEPGGAAVVNGDIAETEILVDAARAAGIGTIVPFGEREADPSRIEQLVLKADRSVARGVILGESVTWKIGAPGRHVAVNSVAVLTAAVLLGADLARCAMALGELSASQGRGSQHRLEIGYGSATLIDESYNANPASMRAAIDLLGQTPVGLRGRRIAVLGDMLELGETVPQLHAALRDDLVRAGIDKVYCAGALMRALWSELPGDMRGAHAETAADLCPVVLLAVVAGDTVMVKGSNGSRMHALVDAFKSKYRAIEHSVEDEEA